MLFSSRFNGKYILILAVLFSLITNSFAAHTTSVSVTPSAVTGGSTNTFTFTITNNGEDAIREINITAPSGFSNISNISCPNEWMGSLTDSTIICTWWDAKPLIEAGQNVNVSFSATAPNPEGDTLYTWNVTTWDTTWEYPNNTYTNSANVLVDVTPPTTSIEPNGSGWTNQNVEFTLTCNDGSGSGCAATYYAIVNDTESCPTTENEYIQGNSGTVTCGEGSVCEKKVCFYSKDNVGNVEDVQWSDPFRIDKEAPTTYDDAPDGWIANDVTVNLSANDGSGSGVANTFYCVDESGSCNPDTPGNEVSVTCPDDSVCTKYVRYYSVDNVGNEEEVKTSGPIQIDKSAPIVGDITVDPTIADQYTNTHPTISASIQDDGSGITGCKYTTDGGATWHDATWDATEGTCTANIAGLSDGTTYTFNIKGIDAAGNEGIGQAVQRTVDGTPPTINNIGVRCEAEDNCGIYPGSTYVRGTITVYATVEDNVSGVNEVTFNLDSASCSGELEQGNGNVYSCKIDTTQLTDGTYTLSVSATDNAGNSASGSKSDIIVDNTPPETTKTYGEGDPYYQDGEGNKWISSETKIELSATDRPSEHAVGVSQIFYRVYSCGGTPGDWQTYDGPFTISEESCHVIEYYSVDNLGNVEGDSDGDGIVDAPNSQTVFVDNSPPETTKTYGEPAVEGTYEILIGEDQHYLHSVHWISPNTPIYLESVDCGDAQNCEAHPAGVKEIWFRILVPCDPQSETCEWEILDETTGLWRPIEGECTGNPLCYPWKPKYIDDYNPDTDGWNLYWRAGSDEGTGPFTIPQESWHKICYYAVDNLDNAEEVKCQDVFVDATPPEVTKAVGEPKKISEDKTFITSNTEITLSCYDVDPHPVGEVNIYYKVFGCGENEPNDWTEYTQPFTIPEESCHIVKYYCEDALGNESPVYEEVDYVDNTPPETTETVGEPSSEDGYWITTQTPITLAATDPEPEHAVGVKEIYYRYCTCEQYAQNNNSCGPDESANWTLYTEPFTIPNECCHKLEFYSVDWLGNREEIHVQEHNVDDTPPTAEITSVEPSESIDGTTFIKGEVSIHGTASDNKCLANYSLKACMSEYGAIIRGANRLLETQNDDGGWPWKATGESETNTLGVTAFGVLAAYRITGEQKYLDSLERAYQYALNKEPRYTDTEETTKGVDSCPDITWLVETSEATGDSKFAELAKERYDNKINVFGSARALAESIRDKRASNWPGLIPWDIDLCIRAALALDRYYPEQGYDEDALEMAEVVYEAMYPESGDPIFDPNDPDQEAYILGIMGAVNAFYATGLHREKLDELTNILLSSQNENGSWPYNAEYDEDIQSTAYAVLETVRINKLRHAKAGAVWLISQQLENGGWENPEYNEITGEVIRALYELTKNSTYCTEIASGSENVSDTLGTWDSTQYDSGLYDIVLTATDCIGNTGEDSMQVYVDNTAPESWTESPEVVEAGENEVQKEFKVCWGANDFGGSGVESVDLWVKDGSAEWVPWKPSDTWQEDGKTCANYLGTIGHKYCFKSRARDMLGNYEDDKDVDDDTVSCTDVAAYTFDIQLFQGWNLISLPVVPIDQSTENVLEDIAENTKVVWAYDPLNPDAVDGWLVYNPEAPEASNLETMTAGYGYWVEMLNDATLTVTGTIMPVGGGVAPPQRTLVPGWNLIGHYGVEPKPAECALWPIYSANRWVQPLWGYSKGAFFQVYEGGEMEPGKGYWIAISSNLPENVMYMMSDCPELG